MSQTTDVWTPEIWTIQGPASGSWNNNFPYSANQNLIIRVINGTGAAASFTFSISVPATASGNAGTPFTYYTAGRTYGSSVGTGSFGPGVTYQLNPSNVISYFRNTTYSNGNGTRTVSIPGTLTIMMGGADTRTLIYDITREFDGSFTVNPTPGASYSGPAFWNISGGTRYLDLTIPPPPVSTTLTLNYSLRNSTHQAQPLRVRVDLPGGGSGYVNFGNVTPTAQGANVIPLSQMQTVIEGELAGQEYVVLLGNRTISSGTFPASGPFVLSVTGEVGGTADGYAFVDGAWVPRGGGENPLLPDSSDPDEGDPVTPTPAPDGAKPGDNEVVAARATAQGVRDALGLGTGSVDAPDLGSVTGQVRVGASDLMVDPISYVPAHTIGGGGAISGFTFSLFGQTYNFDYTSFEGSWVIPVFRQLLLWVMYVFAAFAGFRILMHLGK